MSSKALPRSHKALYALGAFGMQTLIAGISFFLMVYYTDVALIPPALASTALLVGKIWDIINDPLFGWYADYSKPGRFGRRRTFLVYGTLPLALSFVFLWMIPDGLSPTAAFLWIALSYILFDTLFTIVSVPYSAMGTELTEDYDERTSLAAYMSIGALLGYISGAILMPALFNGAGEPHTGYAMAACVLGLIAGITIGFLAWKLQEPMAERGAQGHKVGFLQGASRVLKNRPFLILITAFSLIRLGLTLLQTTLVYFILYQVQTDKALIPGLMMLLLVTVGFFIPLWKWIAERWNKNIAYALGMTFTSLAVLASFWIQPNQLLFTRLLFICVGAGMAAHWVVPWAMLPDAINYARRHKQERNAGIYYGLYGLADKITRTLGTVSVGWVLQWVGYVPNVAQAEQALTGIRLLFGPVPALFIFLAVPLLISYPINRRIHTSRQKTLQEIPEA